LAIDFVAGGDFSDAVFCAERGNSENDGRGTGTFGSVLGALVGAGFGAVTGNKENDGRGVEIFAAGFLATVLGVDSFVEASGTATGNREKDGRGASSFTAGFFVTGDGFFGVNLRGTGFLAGTFGRVPVCAANDGRLNDSLFCD